MGTGLVGTIKSWKPDRRFGFITAIDGSGDYYFHVVDLEDQLEQLFMRRGLAVQFTSATSKGRPRAIGVSLRDTPDITLLQSRVLTALTISSGFLLARDDESGSTVFVGRHALRDGKSWNSIAEGTKLTASVQAERGDRFAAVPGSVVVG